MASSIGDQILLASTLRQSFSMIVIRFVWNVFSSKGSILSSIEKRNIESTHNPATV